MSGVFRIPNVQASRIAELEAKVEVLTRKLSELACVVHPLLAYGSLIDTSPPKETLEPPTGG
jgi:hypothetical protein